MGITQEYGECDICYEEGFLTRYYYNKKGEDGKYFAYCSKCEKTYVKYLEK